jgi:hypothetical protein
MTYDQRSIANDAILDFEQSAPPTITRTIDIQHLRNTLRKRPAKFWQEYITIASPASPWHSEGLAHVATPLPTPDPLFAVCALFAKGTEGAGDEAVRLWNVLKLSGPDEFWEQYADVAERYLPAQPTDEGMTTEQKVATLDSITDLFLAGNGDEATTHACLHLLELLNVEPEPFPAFTA